MRKTRKSRNMIAKAVSHIRPQIIGDKRTRISRRRALVRALREA